MYKQGSRWPSGLQRGVTEHSDYYRTDYNHAENGFVCESLPVRLPMVGCFLRVFRFLPPSQTDRLGASEIVLTRTKNANAPLHTKYNQHNTTVQFLLQPKNATFCKRAILTNNYIYLISVSFSTHQLRWYIFLTCDKSNTNITI